MTRDFFESSTPQPQPTITSSSTLTSNQPSPKGYPNSSYSNEADDEHSSDSDSDLSNMGPDHDRPQYEGEDTRLTSRKELSGFYAYGWAAEVFVVCGIGSFIPMTLEQLARERGVLAIDHKTPCRAGFSAPEPPFNYTSPSFTAAASPETAQCVVNILGRDINTASFAMYTFSVSVLVQALLIISMSGAADHGRFRKTLLLIFAFSGGIATMLFLAVVPKLFMIGALLAIIANTCYGATSVLINSFLPLLVRNHPTIRYPNSSSSVSVYSNESDEDYHGTFPVETTALLHDSGADVTPPTRRSPATTTSHELRLSTKFSSYGIAIGYSGALLLQTLAIVIVVLTGSSLFSLRLVLFVVGVWWTFFTFPAAYWLRPRPGPPLETIDGQGRARTWLGYFLFSWKSLIKTVTHARRLKDLLFFLGAWFLLSDGIATVVGTAVLFAKTTLEMKPAALALINVIATLAGVVGAVSWNGLSLFMGLKPTHTIIACIILFELIPLYGLLGFIPAVKSLGFLGLQQPWEMYPLGALYGFVLGGLSSYCRSLFGELIPPGFETAFFALFAITDKGSSIFGPAIVGAITDATGGIRPAFIFLAVLIAIPIPLMLMVDVERGKKEALEMARTLEYESQSILPQDQSAPELSSSPPES
ncbi:hypothetical protein K402DRAFT_453044 [Aulographum hederae CBS 113979]|uniref:Autophagy-related protein n=1 Tax=Aulographum hederae CBS 113979 TaxID=1176131 RepID=A0A6G1H5S9_9PEZI|nr:hypothetical protein K402DRAFT_453044 [Aulographum hederae CBS 113979]